MAKSAFALINTTPSTPSTPNTPMLLKSTEQEEKRIRMEKDRKFVTALNLYVAKRKGFSLEISFSLKIIFIASMPNSLLFHGVWSKRLQAPNAVMKKSPISASKKVVSPACLKVFAKRRNNFTTAFVESTRHCSMILTRVKFDFL
jgi:hypothetical protein